MTQPRNSFFIGGTWQGATGREPIVVINPATEEPMGSVPAGESTDIDAAVTAARAAFDGRFTACSRYRTTNVPVTLSGIGFFDKAHGQRGMAPNAIELHPVLSLAFGS